MKLFRRITAIVLTLVVIAVLGISASAASFSQTINGDFGVFAFCEGNLSANAITAWATMFEADYDYIEIVGQELSVEYTFAPVGSTTWYIRNRTATEQDSTVDLNIEPPAGCEFLNATYNYNAYYTVNGIDCHLYHGPVALAMP